MPLTGNQRRHLRALGHALEPVVQVGKGGVSPGLLAQLDEALEAHELVKVKLGKECPAPIAAVAEQLATKNRCQVPQIIGRTLLCYRQRANKPKIVLPQARQRAQQSP